MAKLQKHEEYVEVWVSLKLKRGRASRLAMELIAANYHEIEHGPLGVSFMIVTSPVQPGITVFEDSIYFHTAVGRQVGVRMKDITSLRVYHPEGMYY